MKENGLAEATEEGAGKGRSKEVEAALRKGVERYVQLAVFKHVQPQPCVLFARARSAALPVRCPWLAYMS